MTPQGWSRVLGDFSFAASEPCDVPCCCLLAAICLLRGRAKGGLVQGCPLEACFVCWCPPPSVLFSPASVARSVPTQTPIRPPVSRSRLSRERMRRSRTDAMPFAYLSAATILPGTCSRPVVRDAMGVVLT